MIWSSLVFALLLGAGDLDGAEQALAKGDGARALTLLGDLADRRDASRRALEIAGRAHLLLDQPESAADPLLRASDLAPEDKALAAEASRACYRAAVERGGMAARAYLADARRLGERARVPLLMGEILLQLREYEAALPHFAAALKDERADRLRSLKGRADCLAGMGDREKERRAAYAAVLEEALMREDLPSAYRAAFTGGAGGRLLQWLDGKIRDAPGDLRLLRYRGYARVNLLLYADAAEDLRRVVKVAPHDLEAKNMFIVALVQVYTENRKAEIFEEAVKSALEILARSPLNSDARGVVNWAAITRWQNGDEKGSVELFQTLHATDGEDALAALNLGAILRRLHRYEEAEAAYRRVLEVYEDDPDVLNDLAILKDGQGLRSEAVHLWKKVLIEEPDNLNALENLYTDAWERGDRDETDRLLALGLAASKARDRNHERWKWFRDRRLWAPRAFAPGKSDPR